MLPKIALDKESLKRHQMFTPAPEEYAISTPVSVLSSTAMAAERLKLAQQELLREEATMEKMGIKHQEYLLDEATRRLLQERQNVTDDQRLMSVANKVQKQLEHKALTTAMAEHRLRDEELEADVLFRTARLNLQERAEAASKIITNEEATYKLRMAGMGQFELRTEEANDQRLRDEYDLQQRLCD